MNFDVIKMQGTTIKKCSNNYLYPLLFWDKSAQ